MKSFLCNVLALAAPLAAASQQPNVVLIVADDLGATDLSGTGSDYHRTPNLDAISRYSLAATRAYACPNCVPARAALWSGRRSPGTGVYTVPPPNRGQEQFRQLLAPPTRATLDPSIVTLAQVLQAAGYTTGNFGKWHLGDGVDGPSFRGFGVNKGGRMTGTLPSHFADANGAFPYLPGLPANGKPHQFMADRLTDEAIDFVNAQTGPFFAAVMHYSPHSPIEAPAADIAAFDNVPIGVHHRNKTYAAMLKNLDDNVGRLVCHLALTDDPRRPGRPLIENTVVIFTSDNGPVLDYSSAFPLRGGKGTLYEGGLRVPLFVLWYQHLEAGSTITAPVQASDLFPTIAAIAGAGEFLPPNLDGVDILSPAVETRGPLFWHFPAYLEDDPVAGTWRTTPVSMIRKGAWKLLFYYETRSFELYDIEADVGELTNVADQNPEAVVDLCNDLRAWLIASGAAMPMDKVTGEPIGYPVVPTGWK